ncbi:conserved hypothetical protein [Flavobacterium psychrophilum]|uniref:DUF2490 domain-containing protein n=1 Tax=Flavobacterium psychrophilum TaxID=96345 RepID=UPI000B7C1784|nr:DUF2490 domain-containing protein [Flavobacterium psychrophilum]EKT4502192.1 DUF2490 domain-containing protein [Flavobacterium psychrophilum]EKT4519289.1 DUF2490 domain-containing protein [Flavobacterium psychrophilum]SNB04382.1 conserved hypothetical protein [Flavobacterium psychrophilum]SNB16794.1 conserved hypothetical protein [Flavobacterium psychrophilum]SNB20561.1 conserved hypothetical protein [Flavobacterium psychrophilum]
MRKIYYAFFILLSIQLHPQDVKKANENNAWISLSGNNSITKNWSILTELNWRRNEGFSKPIQNELKLGINYKVNKTHTVTLGWAHNETYSYGALSRNIKENIYNNYSYNEQRLFEQLSITHPSTNRILYDSRFRFEQRWIQNKVKVNNEYVRPSEEYLALHPDSEDWKFRQRIRYRLRIQIPLTKKEMADGTLFFSASDEIFLNVGNKIAANIYDQNRAIIGLGWRFNKNTNIQFAYLNHFIERSNGIAKENNHTFLSTLNFNIDFSAKK